MLFKCKMCGGDLDLKVKASVGVCQYCDTKQTLPRLDDERRAGMYNRANHFRLQNEYDKAAGIYESILGEEPTDAEAYWSLVLCRFGVEYVDDPAGKKVPTCNRAQLGSIFADEDYRQTIANADNTARAVYEAEAKAIDSIQKGILEISAHAEPFDIFLCYKEADAQGRRTRDSVLAQELYGQLLDEGYRVFFSRITLEDKAGTDYESYIFAALQSARIMIALGTRPEHFSAVWVKNEWSRYLGLIKGGAKKNIIPVYKEMDPYDLPEEFTYLHIQAQDMGKIGFTQDLLRGIKKLLGEQPVAAVATAPTAQLEPLYRRALLFLEDGDFTQANTYLDRVLDIAPDHAPAYVGKLCAERKVRQESKLGECDKPLAESPNFQKAQRFADAALQGRLIKHEKAVLRDLSMREYKSYMERKQKIGNPKDSSGQSRAGTDYMELAKSFLSMKGFEDTEVQAAECQRLAREWEKQAKESEKRENAAYNKKKRKVRSIVMVVLLLVAVGITAAVLASQHNENVVKPTRSDDALEAAFLARNYRTVLNNTAYGATPYGKQLVEISKTLEALTYEGRQSVQLENSNWWIVCQEENRVLIGAERGINMPYHIGGSSAWETSDIRSYINGEWYDEQGETIKRMTIHNGDSDTVFIMSADEFQRYYPDGDTPFRGAPYAGAMWLRTSSKTSGKAAIVDYGQNRWNVNREGADVTQKSFATPGFWGNSYDTLYAYPLLWIDVNPAHYLPERIVY